MKKNSFWDLVVNYQVSWRVKDDLGVIHLFLSNNRVESIQPKTLSDASALADLLRSEKPIYFNRKSKDITTGREPIGEQEDGIQFPQLRARA